KDFNDILLRDKEIFTDLKTQDKRVKKIPIIAYVLQDIHKRLQQGNSIENKAKILKQVSLFLNSIKDSYIRLEYNKYANKLFGFNISHIKTIPNNNTSYNPNIISYNLTMARVLKAAYNNREYKEILRQNTNPSYFHPLEQSYIDCMQEIERERDFYEVKTYGLISFIMASLFTIVMKVLGVEIFLEKVKMYIKLTIFVGYML
ncbi:MAG: hypothetical protein MR025_07560, partial [Helicobacter trogontum]|uniref:hypothetical protein n=1 Tax=Helicobacter trogontum TaxID=50960 RepID=UPI00242DEE04